MLKNKKVQNCKEALKTFIPQDFKPQTGIVLGTGLGLLADDLENSITVPYSSLPDYPQSTVDSHNGNFIFGYIKNKPVVLQSGRCHLYEGYTPEEVVRGIRIMAALGIEKLVITNAAGSLNPLFMPGGIMLITDHINFTGQSPLTGVLDHPERSRFTDMSRVYDEDLCKLAEKSALKLGILLEKGVYLGLNGPQMETRAETRMFRLWGADAVGMSTVMEVIAARHLGLRVLGLSLLSNQNLPDAMLPASLEEVINVSSQSSPKLKQLVSAIIKSV